MNSRYEGGIGANAREAKPRKSVAETLSYWLDRNSCHDMPTQTRTVGNAHCARYGPGRDGAVVELWTLEDGGHTWPGGESTLSRDIAGHTNTDIIASEVMWDFLGRFSLR